MGLLDSLKENKHKVMVRVGTAIAGLASLALLLPIIYSAFLASLGLLGVGILAVIGIGIFQAIPLLGQKWENVLLGARKAEARANPIEQLQNTLLKRKAQISNTEEALGRIGGIVRSMERMLDEQSRRDPDHDLSIPRKSLEAMQRFYTTNMEKLKLAIQAANQYAKEIDRKKFELTFVEAGRSAMASVEGAEGDAMQELLSDEAFKSVSDQFDKIFGELEVRSVLDQAEQIENTHITFEGMMHKQLEAVPVTKERGLG